MALYFRLKDNGATVFRMVEDGRSGRLDLTPIAEANARNGAIKPRGGAPLPAEEADEIRAWIETRSGALAIRDAATPDAAIEAINAAAHWISGKPDLAAADRAADPLLLAMHDLRAAIVRYKANRIAAEEDGDADPDDSGDADNGAGERETQDVGGAARRPSGRA